MGNDPILNNDPSGGWAATGVFEGLSRTGILTVTTLTGAIIGTGADLLSGGDGLKGFLIGAGLGLGSNLGFRTLTNLAVPISLNISLILMSNISTQVGTVDGGAQQNTLQQIISRGKSQSPTFTVLFNKAGLTDDNASDYISFDDFVVGGDTDPDNGHIRIQSLRKLDDQVATLAHELTNRINLGTFHRLKIDVSNGTINPVKYAQMMVHEESESLANQQIVADDLHIKNLDYTNHYKTKADLLKKIYKAQSKLLTQGGVNALKHYEDQGKKYRKKYLLEKKLAKLKSKLKKLEKD